MYNMCIHALNWQRNLFSTNYFPPFSTIANYVHYCMNFQFVRIYSQITIFQQQPTRLDEERNRCKLLRSTSKIYREVYFEHVFVRFCYTCIYFSIYFLAMLRWLILLRCCSNCQCKYCCNIFHKRIIGAPVILLSATTEL